MPYKRQKVWVLVPQDSCNGDTRVFATKQGLDDWLDAHGLYVTRTLHSTLWLADQDAGTWYADEREVM
jgi:hypothetical protein